MTVETQLIDVPFSGGVDEKTRAELVSPPSFAQLINLRQIKRGSYQKRFGHTLVSNVTLSGSVVPACKRLIAYKDELLQTNNLNLYTRGTTTGAWTATTGMAPQLQITDQPVVALQSAVGSYDCLYLNGYYILAYTLSQTAGANYSIFATIIDAANGAVVAAPFNVTNGVVNGVAPWIRLVSAGNVAVLVYSSDGTYGASISRSWVSLASNATINTGWAAVATLVTDTSATAGIPHVFDACTVGANFVLAYVNNTTGVATTTVTLRSYNSAIVQQAVSSVACSAAAAYNGPRCLSISGNAADTIFMAYPLNDTAVFQVVGLNPTTLVANATPLTVVTVTNASVTGCAVLWTGTGTGIVLCGDGTTGTPGRMNIRTFQVSAGAVIGVSGYLTCQGFNFDSRPFLSNGRAYATVRPTAGGTPIPDPNQLLLVDLTQTVTDFQNGFGKPYLRVVGNITPRLAYGGHFAGMTGGSGNCIMPTSVAAVSATKFVVASPALKNAVSSSLDLVTLDWGATNLSQPCILGETVALGGSPPSFYDGVRASEIGFFQRPLITGFAFSGIGLTGAYKYIAVYEQIDARGQWHQSNASDAFPVNPVNQGVVVSVSTLQATNRVDYLTSASPSPVRVALYRTTNGGNVYQRVFASGVINDTALASVTFIPDTVVSTALGAPCYAQPGIPNTAQFKVTPPALSCMIAHGDRLVGCDGKTIWFSGQNIYGEGYWFADLFQFTIETGGPITALASMDGDLIVFKRGAIAFVYGQGPPDNGAGGDFSPPQFIATDVGCIEPRSVVVTPAGTIFLSLKSFELLSRSRQLTPGFGYEVEDSITANPVVTSAVLDELQGQVTFTCLPTEGSATGITITYNYVFGVWTTGTVGDGTTANVAAKSAIMWGQQPATTPIRTWLQSTGNVFQESTTSYLDAGAWVSTTALSPWIKANGVAGFQMARSLILQAQRYTGHDLTISIAYDYSASYTDVRTWTAAQLAALSTSNEALQVDLTQPECTAFRVKITDATPSSGVVGTGQGASLWGMQIEVGANGLLTLLPEGNRQ